MSYLPLVDIPAADLELVKKNLMTNTTFLFGSYWPPHPDTLCKRLLEVNDLTADQVRAIVDKLKLRIEEERRRKWDDTASKGAICAAPASEAIQAAVREAAPRPEDVSRWTGSDGAAQAPGDPTIRYYNRETGEIQDTPPSPDLNSYYGGNMQSPSPTPPSDQPRQSVVSAPTVPDVMISIRILRDADRYPCTFVLKIGDSGMVPATCEGPFEELYGRLTRQLSEHLNMFRPGHCQVPIPEQIIMEPH